MNSQKMAGIFLRLSIASVFLYAAAAATIEPNNWIGYIPDVLRKNFNGSALLIGFSVFQLMLALWILSGKKAVWAGLLSALTLLLIMAANFSQIDILFRDLAIFFAALALTVRSS